MYVSTKSIPLRALVWVSVALLTTTLDAGTLPLAPPGQHWELQGTFVFTDTADGSTMFNLTDVVDTASNPTSQLLDETLSLTTFDATGDATNHFCVISSTVWASLSGSGSGTVANLTVGNEQAPDQGFFGEVSLLDWEISGAAASGPASDSLTRSTTERLSMSPMSIGVFSDFATGDGNALLNFSASNANSVHDGSALDVDFDGQFVVDVISPSGPSAGTQLTVGTGSASLNAQLTTVYEHYVLVPEPTGMAFVGIAGVLAVGLRRRRRASRRPRRSGQRRL